MTTGIVHYCESPMATMRISTVVWNSLRLDDPDRRKVATACFYLGMGVEQTRSVILDPYSPNSQYLLETAAFMGMTDSDYLEKV